MKKSDLITSVSQFVGPCYKTVSDKKKDIKRKCDLCGKEDATWLHQTRSGKFALVCFTCGNH